MLRIGETIKNLRLTRKLTQSALAKRLGISKATITAYECDIRLPSHEALIKLAAFFNVTIDSLLLNREEYIIDTRDLSISQINQISQLIEDMKSEPNLKIIRTSETSSYQTEKIQHLINKMKENENNDIIDVTGLNTKQVELLQTIANILKHQKLTEEIFSPENYNSDTIEQISSLINKSPK